MKRLALVLPLLLAGCPKEETKQPEASPAAITFASPAAGPADGATVFQTRCAMCHGDKGAGGMGPKLAGVGKKGEAYVRGVVVEGRADKGMPPFDGQLTDPELKAVVGYVKAL